MMSIKLFCIAILLSFCSCHKSNYCALLYSDASESDPYSMAIMGDLKKQVRVVSPYEIYFKEAPEWIKEDTTILGEGDYMDTIITKLYNGKRYDKIVGRQYIGKEFIIYKNKKNLINRNVNLSCDINYCSTNNRAITPGLDYFVTNALSSCSTNSFFYNTGIDTTLLIRGVSHIAQIIYSTKSEDSMRAYLNDNVVKDYIQILYLDKTLLYPLRKTILNNSEGMIIKSDIDLKDIFFFKNKNQYDLFKNKMIFTELPLINDSLTNKFVRMHCIGCGR